jgi:hypothetical protein
VVSHIVASDSTKVNSHVDGPYVSFVVNDKIPVDSSQKVVARVGKKITEKDSEKKKSKQLMEERGKKWKGRRERGKDMQQGGSGQPGWQTPSFDLRAFY